MGKGSGTYDNLDYTPGLNGRNAKIGNLGDLVFDKYKDTLYINQVQRITQATRRLSSLKFQPELVDKMVGSGAHAVKTSSNSAQNTSLVMLSAPLNVSFANDSVQIPANAETGTVVFQASQVEDLDSIYTTIVRDTFQVIPFVAVSSLQSNPFLVYPNPVQAGNPAYLVGLEEGSSLYVFNSLGIEVEMLLAPASGTAKLNLTKPGLYFLRIEAIAGKGIYSAPILVK